MTFSTGNIQDRVTNGPASPRRNVDAVLLRTFLACIETGTLQRASEKVCRTQAAVSQQLKRLEEVTGVSIFEKKGRKLSLTPSGHRLISYAKEVLIAHDEMLLAMTVDGSTARMAHGKVSLFSPSTRTDISRCPSIVKVTSNPTNRRIPDSVAPVKQFEDCLRSTTLKNILDAWREARSQDGIFTIDTLVNKGLISRSQNLGQLFVFDNSNVLCIDATESEAKDYGLDKHGYGCSVRDMVANSSVFAQRHKIWMTCHHAGVPVAFSGNPVVPPSFDFGGNPTEYMCAVLERLLLPVQIERLSESCKGKTGILQVAAWDEGRSYTWLLNGAEKAPQEMNITEEIIFGF